MYGSSLHLVLSYVIICESYSLQFTNNETNTISYYALNNGLVERYNTTKQTKIVFSNEENIWIQTN